MAGRDDSVELALRDLENEPLPDRTRDHSAPEGAEDEIQIRYAEDGEETPPQEPPREEPRPPQREVGADKGIAELRARLKASDDARRQAEERANQAEAERVQATGQTQDAYGQWLATSLDGVRQSMSVLEANLAEAYAVQDFAGAAKIQVEIAKHAQREMQIEAGIEQLKSQPREQPRPQPVNEVEAVAQRLTPNAAAWVRAHPEYITNPRLNRRLLDAHDDAMDAGLTPDSYEYIRFVEDQVLSQQQRGPQPREQQYQPPSHPYERREPVPDQYSRRSAPPPAPVSRGANGGGRSPTSVTLTRDQVETAHQNFPDEMREDPTGRKAEQAYAKNLLILDRENRLLKRLN